ncbi:fasciclin domain-containing protein [Aquimarina brevivitae]|uniref:Putative surface protein with fasciclin (FAS1) repeats n=1 Tax=Aquimarina brevivitae TaxID=323412 RepID=A0A4Q7PLX3_9FLAO|nr:fasciclin domain-containing protein [Aquimarina brevivitae]RZS99992.1 putative surface protein with fasciclin (FAS1) repeats [Aquimarina brevivitae]
MKNLIKFTFIALFVVVGASCSNDDDGEGPLPEPDFNTIADIVAGDDDYSSLLAALEKTGLDETLAASGTFTVFAPDNAAFATFLNGASLDDVSNDDLTQILLNHVLGTTVTSSQLATGYVSNLAENADGDNLSMYINIESGVEINGVSSVTQADVVASNGVIHFVDEVIPVPTVTTFATADATFSTLVTALTTLTPDTDYAATLSGTAGSPFTVFAPTNAAFDDLLARFGLNDFSSLTAAQLEIVLNYHVLAGANVRSGDLPGIPNGITPATLQGETLLLNLDGGAFLRDKTGVDAEITVVDVQAANGVIHVIDKVLLPNAALDALGRSITAFAYNGGESSDFSSLYAALRQTGLNDVLDDATLRTVFAPTNASFTAFLDGVDLADVSNEVLTQVLLNHVVSGSLLSTDLSTSYANTLATYADTDNNLSLYINTASGVVLNGGSANGGATVTEANNEVRNGVIHVVDAVIGLPTVVTFAVADPNFSTLESALTTLTPSTDFVSVLSAENGTGSAPFTVFAPINDAFDAITIPADENDLAAVLNYHVVAGANVTSADLVDGVVTTLNGDVTIDATAQTVLGASNTTASNIIAADVQASNGVIHAIDRVLLPAQ